MSSNKSLDHSSKTPVTRDLKNGARVTFSHTEENDYFSLATRRSFDGPLRANAVTVHMHRNEQDIIELMVTMPDGADCRHVIMPRKKHKTNILAECRKGDYHVYLSRTSQNDFTISNMTMDGNTEGGQEYLFNLNTHEIAYRNVIRPVDISKVGRDGLVIR